MSMTEPQAGIDAAMESRLDELDQAHDSPLRRRMDRLIEDALRVYPDIDAAGDAAHLRKTLAGLALETSAVRMGFILGYEAGRDSREAHDDIEKGGAR